MSTTADIVATAAPPVFEAKDVTKSYGRVQAVDQVDFALRSREVVGLLGDNGAGKSTLIKIMSGIIKPDSGQFHHRGRAVPIRSREDSQNIGIETIYQEIALVGSMSIMRNIFAGREIVNGLGFLRFREMNRIAMDLLENHVQIAGITSPAQLVERLSGGQQQAVAIARAQHFRSEILLLDEPTSALSVRETEKVLSDVLRLRDEGLSCVVVTHNIHHAFRVSDRFVIMSHGRVIRDVAKKDTSVEELTELIVSN